MYAWRSAPDLYILTVRMAVINMLGCFFILSCLIQLLCAFTYVMTGLMTAVSLTQDRFLPRETLKEPQTSYLNLIGAARVYKCKVIRVVPMSQQGMSAESSV